MKQLTDEQRALGAFLAAMQECGHDGAKMREAMMGVLGITGEAQPDEQANGLEAFGTFVERNDGTTEFRRAGEAHSPTAQGYKFWTLYTTPPAQHALEWVGLTKDEIWTCADESQGLVAIFARAIESKLKEKNGY